MTLTDNQKLERTETIARACGWEGYRHPNIKRNFLLQDESVLGKKLFSPFADWNDAMRAADALGVDYYMQGQFRNDSNVWSTRILDSEQKGAESTKLHPDRLTAFCLALHEIAKAKLEDEE